MMKTTLALIAVLVLASTSYGSVLVYSFENDNEGFPNITTFSTTGATVGSYAAALDNHGWLYYQNSTGDFTNVARVNTAVLMDVTWMGAPNQQIMIQLACNGGTYTSGYKPMQGNGVTETLTFDYGTTLAALPENAWGYFKIGLVGGTGSVAYLDNVRFTPEPATMALLGMGGLALLRRRR